MDFEQQKRYALWLVNDQCKGLLKMRDIDIATIIGLSRPTVQRRREHPELFTLQEIEQLRSHVEFVKANLLTTEAGILQKEKS